MPLSQLQVRCLQTPHEPPRARQQISRSRALPQILPILITLANAFRGTLLQVLDWVGDNQIWLTVVSVGGVTGWVMWSNRHGMTQGETVDELIHDFDPDGDAGATARAELNE